MDPYSTVELDDGTVLQAGVPTYEEGLPNWESTAGYISRGVVLKTYYTDDSEWANRGWASTGMRAICCDVRVFGRQNRTLYRVPVAQRTHTLFDEDCYIPRDSSQNIDGGTMTAEPASGSGAQPTQAQKLDGDQVLVGFLECDPRQPVILPFCLPHPQARQEYKQADGRVKRMRHNGVLIEWDKDGNLTIDARKAAKADLAASGTEDSNSGTAGKIKIVTTDGTDESSIELDNTGTITLIDGSTGKIEMKKSSKTITIDAKTKIDAKATTEIDLTAPTIKVNASTALQATSPAMTFNASATFGLTCPAVTITASGTFLVTSASVTLGSAAAMPLVKHTPWATGWSALAQELQTQVQTYTGPPPPAVVAVADYLKLLTKLQTIATGFATAMTAIVKGT